MERTPPAGWTQEGHALVRTIKRDDFLDALGLVLAIAGPAQRADHHPDIDLRYNQVRLSLSTHSAGHRITERDFALAEEINRLTGEQIQCITRELRQRIGS
jgi:4a-hydroxytetrahydrobiopterin dehydratase